MLYTRLQFWRQNLRKTNKKRKREPFPSFDSTTRRLFILCTSYQAPSVNKKGKASGDLIMSQELSSASVGKYIHIGENPALISENFHSNTETILQKWKIFNGQVKPE